MIEYVETSVLLVDTAAQAYNMFMKGAGRSGKMSLLCTNIASHPTGLTVASFKLPVKLSFAWGCDVSVAIQMAPSHTYQLLIALLAVLNPIL